MKKKILISEQELVKLISVIVESEDNVSDYDDFDLHDIFILVFRNWLKKKFPTQYENYPLSYLIRKHLKEFLVENGLNVEEFKSYDGEINLERYRLRTLISHLVRNGIITLPKVPTEKKITERYKKALDFFVQQLELPSYAKLTISEPSTNKIEIKLDFDFLEFIKSDAKIPSSSSLDRKFREFFESYLGLEIGDPIHGEVSIQVHKPIYHGQNEWVTNVLNKDLKKKIRQLPNAKGLHSIKYSIDYLKPKFKFTFKYSAGYNSRRELKTQVDQLLKSMGYNNFEIEI